MQEEQKFAVMTLDVGSQLRALSRGEWWLWVSTVSVMTLSTMAYVMLSFAAMLAQNNAYLPIQQAAWGLLSLILLFNIHAAHRQWHTRRKRKELIAQAGGEVESELAEVYPSTPLDPLTGLCCRPLAEQVIAREMVAARRANRPLTLLLLDVNDFREMNRVYGNAFGDAVLYSFAKRLRKATRGSDMAARLGGDEFLLVLPDCNVAAVRHVLERMKPVEVEWRGRRYCVDFAAAWVDYRPGEMPSELLRRVDDVLALYRRAASESQAAAVA